MTPSASSIILIVTMAFYAQSKILVRFHDSVVSESKPTAANARFIRIGILAMDFSAYLRTKVRNQLTANGGDHSDIKSLIQRLAQFSENYVHFLEDVQIEVFPILIRESKRSIQQKMRHLNGVLLTGGAPGIQVEGRPSEFDEIRLSDTSTQRYFKVVNRILRYATKINEEGRPFLVYGVCMGFESMVLFESNYAVPLTMIPKKNVSDRIYLTHTGNSFSNYLSSLPTSEWLSSFENGRAFFYNEKGVAVSNFIANSSLRNSYDVLAYYIVTSEESEDTYVGAIQHKRYPFFAVQFHPEKVLYETSSHYRITKSQESKGLARIFQNYLPFLIKRFDIRNDSPENDGNFLPKGDYITVGQIGSLRNIRVFGSPEDLSVLETITF